MSEQRFDFPAQFLVARTGFFQESRRAGSPHAPRWSDRSAQFVANVQESWKRVGGYSRLSLAAALPVKLSYSATGNGTASVPYSRAHCSFRFDRAQVPIQPIEGLLDELVPGYHMPCFKNGMALVFFGCSEETKHRLLEKFRAEIRNHSGH